MSSAKEDLPKKEPVPLIYQLLVIANRLNIKAFRCKTREALLFVILNDTIHLVRYDRAILWDFENPSKPKCLGISGQTTFSKNSELVRKITKIVKSIKNPKVPQQLTANQLVGENEIWNDLQAGKPNSLVLWLPIHFDDKLILGLWLEKWNVTEKDIPTIDVQNILSNFLLESYGVAWNNVHAKKFFKHVNLSRTQWLLLALSLVASLFIIHIPLRIAAPCEVVPKDPIIVAAPLEGIIEKVVVKPGETVHKDDILVEYHKTVFLQNLKVAQKQVQILQADVNRAMTLGFKDERSLSELAVLKLKLEKEKLALGLAEYYASKLIIKAPQEGIVIIDNPDEWRGKPVQIGEKILILSNEQNTKIRIWLPENDNIVLDPKRNIKIFLNIKPEISYRASLIYVAAESIVTEKHLASFIAEADWIDKPKEVKLGLKGTAILYGENVSIFYFIIRKPWASVRNFIGF